MVFFLFALAAAITVFAAIKLSTYADVISEKTALGGMLIGTILLAGATSLPEVTTSITAVVIGSPDLAVGNVLGSNMFNLLIIASFDLYFRKQQIFTHAAKENYYTAGIGLILALTTVMALLVRTEYTFLGIGLDTFTLLFIYTSGMLILTLMSKRNPSLPANEPGHDYHHTAAISLKRATYGFIIASIIILGSGTLLTFTGDEIAIITGLGATFVGSFLIALSTSLPEAVAVLVACQLRNYNLAIGSILGSNLFNFLILAGTDAIYQQGSLLSISSDLHIITASAVTILSIIMVYSLLRKKARSPLAYAFPSTILIIVYFISTYLIYSY
ncbi:sodium:calcium antiporter [Desertibacillus haloalkaliphilus]|uniref:sodium:calcium antiporter n=1 Tax=Desertibacillus haloalkaliphilus TaxID=1328930 RepID=UPI001C27C6DF|nr:sodium:calcium antiporter [Desertibacillus haloalkaliphilus]MBU8906922.1 sodium:calcium antiporter [Desertibacillus haloalkaliphilus]